jgi:hypothetical protein
MKSARPGVVMSDVLPRATPRQWHWDSQFEVSKPPLPFVLANCKSEDQADRKNFLADRARSLPVFVVVPFIFYCHRFTAEEAPGSSGAAGINRGPDGRPRVL